MICHNLPNIMQLATGTKVSWKDFGHGSRKLCQNKRLLCQSGVVGANALAKVGFRELGLRAQEEIHKGCLLPCYFMMHECRRHSAASLPCTIFSLIELFQAETK